MQGVDGGEASELVPFDNHIQFVGSWSADGRSVVYERYETYESAPRSGDLWIVDVNSLERRPLLETPSSETSPEISPDGRWIAYTSQESGRAEIYVASFPFGKVYQFPPDNPSAMNDLVETGADAFELAYGNAG